MVTMVTIRKTIFMALLVSLATFCAARTSMAQYGTSDSSTLELVRSIETHTATLRNDVQLAINRGNVSNNQIYQLNRLITDFATSTNQLDRRLSVRRATSADVSVVLNRALLVDNFFAANRLGPGANRAWQTLRGEVDQLARIYNLSWQGNSGGSPSSDYNLSDTQLRQLVQRIDTRSTNFSRFLRQDLIRRNASTNYPVDSIRQYLTQYESAVMQLRNRVNRRQVVSQDSRNVLDRASFLNNVVATERFSNQTESQWNVLRQDLDRLASAFNIAWNWSTVPDGGYGTVGSLTGTYRLNSSSSDDARRIAEQGTRSLPATERQRVYDSLVRRLDPPNMLAIDQRGNVVTIASTRAPQINFVADGSEHLETGPNGRTIRVKATLNGDQLSIARTGDRADDFGVTFDPSNNGRQLLVTRTLYSDRLSQPLLLRTYYDRTSDVAQLNIYETNPEGTNAGSASGSFVIPNGTQVVAVLNNNLSTQSVRDNDRFTMTVRSPGQYEGASIEGYVSNVDRSGRISGRAEMTLNFDTIRLRNGSTYRFAGILDSVRTPDGEVVRIDNEGAVRDEESQTNRTVTRTAIGTAVGAIIGAIAGGGKGAAIGAVIGAGAGAGSVYVQGRNDLDLPAGTEVTVRATGPRY